MASSARPRGRKVNVLQAFALLIAFLLVAGIGGVLAAGLVLPAAATVSTVTDGTAKVFDDLPSTLGETPLSQKSTIYAADNTVLATFYNENRIVVALADISPLIKTAVIATEDKRFYDHGGVDPAGMFRALIKNATSNDVQGASTLTQQYVKNVLIEAAVAANDPAGIRAAQEVTASRKLREAKLAISLEKTLTKDEILGRYLNIAPFGRNVYGIEAATQYYFGHPSKEMTVAEAATLAGVTNSPTKYDPQANTAEAEKRRNVVLVLMRDQGKITAAQFAEAVATPLASMLHITQTGLGCMSANTVNGVAYNAGFFCDYVTWVIKNNPAFGATAQERLGLLYRGGLDIHTTIDLRMQQIADTEVKNGVPQNDPSGLSSSLVSVEPGTGKIVAMAENRTFNNSADHADRETSINYNTDEAYGGSTGFQPGSSFKPFTLLAWLQDGHSLSETIDTAKKTYSNMSWPASCLDGGRYRITSPPWTPANSEGGSMGIISALSATTHSVNTGYLAMAGKLDLCDPYVTAKNLGVHNTVGKDMNVVPSGIIGGGDSVAPLTMASAYAAMAANGVFCEPIAITSVLDSNDKQLPVPQANCRQALDPKVAATATYALQTVISSGTAAGMHWPASRPAAGKTGTTDESKDTWFVGYTPQLATAVWTGHSNSKSPLKNVRVNGAYYGQIYGATINAPTWKRFMLGALANTPAVGFPQPDSVLLQGAKIAVPDVTGKSPSSAQSTLQALGFNVKTAAAPEYSNTDPAGTVSSTNPSGGTSVPKGSWIELRISAGPDPAAQAPANPGNQQGPGNSGKPPKG
jgi:membrane peptidoglycan carboxypeptidase